MTIFDSVRRARRPAQGFAVAITVCAAMIACSSSDHPPAAGSSGSSGGVLDGSGNGLDGGSNDGALPDGRRPLDDGGSGDGAIDASACQALPFVGAFIDEQGVADVAPAATGGSITAGTYDLEALTVYDPAAAAGPTGRVAQSTLAITANRLTVSENRAMRLPGGTTSAPMQTTSAYSYMLKNQNLYAGMLCPMSGNEPVIPFTATADTLLIFPDPTHSLAYRIRP
jgi:hypothetical protein